MTAKFLLPITKPLRGSIRKMNKSCFDHSYYLMIQSRNVFFSIAVVKFLNHGECVITVSFFLTADKCKKFMTGTLDYLGVVMLEIGNLGKYKLEC